MARREQVTGPGSRAIIVDIVRSAGSISRVELAELTGLTQPAVSGIVRRLIADGVIRETGRSVSTGGKPRAMLEINSHAVYGMGIQLDRDVLTCIVADTTGGVVGRQSAPVAATPDSDAFVAQIAALFTDVVTGLDLDRASVAGVAVVAPGPLDTRAGVLLGPASPGILPGERLRRRVEEAVAVPVAFDNNAAAAAVGEFWSRQVSRESVFAVVYLGTGVGGGIVLDGALFRGASSNTAELGHLPVEPDGRSCWCGSNGCLERYVAPAVLVEEARRRPALAELLAGRDDADAYDRLSHAAVAGDADALAVIETGAAVLAQGVLGLANLFDLDHIVLAGPGFAISGSIWARVLREHLAAKAFARALHGIRVELAADPRDSAAIGAAAIVLQGSVSPGHGPTTARLTA